MSIQKTTQTFIGGGSALSANNTALSSIAVQLGIVGSDMTTLNPAGGDTITTQPDIRIVNRFSDGTFKIGNTIKGTSVTSYKGEHYVPAKRCVWALGYNRVTAAGSINASNSTDYTASIIFKHDKDFYGVRPERLSIEFTSAAAATQSTIADQIVSKINNSSFGNEVSGVKTVKAVKIGDGTGIHGLTTASNYGVEIWGLDINQFQNTQYGVKYVNFSVHVDDSSGFDTTTTCTNIQYSDPGIGTYNQAYTNELKSLGVEGVLNRTKWPIPTLTTLATSTLVTSGNVAAAATTPTGNLSAVAVGDDTLTVATATTGIRAGEIIDVNGVEYEVMYVLSSTKLRIVDTATAVYGGGANLKVKYAYNVINISVSDLTIQDGSGASQVSRKSFNIFTPAIDASAADPFDRTLDSADTSAECLDILDILDAWMTSTPLAPANVTLA